MRREISSSFTQIYKILFIAVFGVILPICYLRDFESFTIKDFILTIVWTLGGVAIIRDTLNLKKVEAANDGLYISQKFFGQNREIFVPFANIKIIKQKNYWLKGKHEKIYLEFENRTRFGTQIEFLSKSRAISISEHPIISELNKQIEAAKSQMKIKARNP